MALFIPAAQPVGVGPTGSIVPVAIPAGYRQHRVARLVVAHLAGSLHFWSACFATDPAVVDPLQEFACYDNELPLSKVDDDHGGVGFTWNGAETKDWSTAPKNVYVRLKVDAGTDNNFVLGIYVNEVQ